MKAIDLNVLLDECIKERDDFIKQKPWFARYQSEIDAKMVNHNTLKDRLVSIAQTARQYRTQYSSTC